MNKQNYKRKEPDKSGNRYKLWHFLLQQLIFCRRLWWQSALALPCGALSICLKDMVMIIPVRMLMCGKEAKTRQRQPRLPLYRIRMEQ